VNELWAFSLVEPSEVVPQMLKLNQWGLNFSGTLGPGAPNIQLN
jgi:hypothetical protein